MKTNINMRTWPSASNNGERLFCSACESIQGQGFDRRTFNAT